MPATRIIVHRKQENCHDRVTFWRTYHKCHLARPLPERILWCGADFAGAMVLAERVIAVLNDTGKFSPPMVTSLFSSARFFSRCILRRIYTTSPDRGKVSGPKQHFQNKRAMSLTTPPPKMLLLLLREPRSVKNAQIDRHKQRFERREASPAVLELK